MSGHLFIKYKHINNNYIFATEIFFLFRTIRIFIDLVFPDDKNIYGLKTKTIIYFLEIVHKLIQFLGLLYLLINHTL